MTNDEFEKEIEALSNSIKSNHILFKKWENYDSIILLEKQAFYTVNWLTKKLDFAKGFEKLLGYNSQELSLLDISHNLIHPEDQAKIALVIKETVHYCINNPIPKEGMQLRISYRMRKANGSYIKVMRHTGLYEKNDKDQLTTNYSFLNDISNFDTSTKMRWEMFLEGKDQDMEKLRNKIQEILETPLSVREKEVLSYIAQEYTNQEISNKLFISVETVKYHKKNLFKKFEVSSVLGLLKKASEEGIIELY
ncbi:MAG: PAS domain-containing protein [Cytophagales bacterium]|nr:PAS domain-containing protein [Cytophagales bacterium]